MNPQPAVFITQIAEFLPNEPVANDEMEAVLGQVGRRPSRARRIILRSNGIHSRYYAIDRQTGEATHSNAELAAEAIRRLEGDHFSLSQLDCLAASTSMPDQLMPSHGSMVHAALGAPPCEVISTSGVCLSGLSALKYAYMAVLSGLHRRAVASGSEAASNIIRASIFKPEVDAHIDELTERPEIGFEKDFLRWMLSDGAGAVLLEPKPREDALSLHIDWIEMLSYANEIESCMYAGAEKVPSGKLKSWMHFSAEERLTSSVMAIKQDVKLLNEKILYYTATRPLAALKKSKSIRANEIDHFLPHYSSNFFRDKLHEAMQQVDFEIPQERWFTNLTEKGNTGSASIYIMLEELFRAGRLRKGEKILCFVPESSRFSIGYMLLTVV